MWPFGFSLLAPLLRASLGSRLCDRPRCPFCAFRLRLGDRLRWVDLPLLELPWLELPWLELPPLRLPGIKECVLYIEAASSSQTFKRA